MKPIDIVEIKAAVKDGQFYVGVSGDGDIYLSDSKSGESVCIAQKMPFLNAMKCEVYADAVAHGLWLGQEYETPVQMGNAMYHAACRIADEVQELKDEAVIASTDCGIQPRFKEELADVIIMALSTAGHFGIDIDSEVDLKRKINKARSWKHGKE